MGKKYNGSDGYGGGDDFGFTDWQKTVPGLAGKYKRCFEDHPTLLFLKGKVVGGNCVTPRITDADIYVGLDYSMTFQTSKYPWHQQKGPIEFQFRIADMAAPSDPVEFHAMIKWLVVQLNAGKTIHIGCLGGHGRTGVVLAALVKTVHGVKDAIQWVRANYCKKAVESRAQITFLMQHYGVSHVEPTKDYAVGSLPLYSSEYLAPNKSKGKGKGTVVKGYFGGVADKDVRIVAIVPTKGAIW